MRGGVGIWVRVNILGFPKVLLKYIESRANLYKSRYLKLGFIHLDTSNLISKMWIGQQPANPLQLKNPKKQLL